MNIAKGNGAEFTKFIKTDLYWVNTLITTPVKFIALLAIASFICQKLFGFAGFGITSSHLLVLASAGAIAIWTSSIVVGVRAKKRLNWMDQIGFSDEEVDDLAWELVRMAKRKAA